jgi:hypothetical protein
LNVNVDVHVCFGTNGFVSLWIVIEAAIILNILHFVLNVILSTCKCMLARCMYCKVCNYDITAMHISPCRKYVYVLNVLSKINSTVKIICRTSTYTYYHVYIFIIEQALMFLLEIAPVKTLITALIILFLHWKLLSYMIPPTT